MWRTIGMVIGVIIIGLGGGVGIYTKDALTRSVSSDKTDQTFVVAENVSSLTVARDLHSQRLIRSPWAMVAYIKIRRWQLQAGRYQLNAAMTIPTIARRIANGDVEKVTVTFPEGWRITQMADRLAAKNLVKKDDFLALAKGKEGYLFPDTYTFSTRTDAATIIATMEQNFQRRTEGLKVTPDVVILASIVEREAKKDEDRPIIAGIYANRLRTGMRLESDPTVQYAKGTWEEITTADYRAVISPYNTYLGAGLPPGPICNAGLKSLEAASKPTATDNYYFFHTENGQTIYSKTLEEHNSNKRIYLK